MKKKYDNDAYELLLNEHSHLLSLAGHDGWAFCKCKIAWKIRAQLKQRLLWLKNWHEAAIARGKAKARQ